MTFDLVALKDEQTAARNARPRRSLDLETESFVRVLPIRWRVLLIAALNATVAVILATLIWNGANVLSRAWDDVRKVRESDKLLVLLESEASRLQNLIHRYINQPSQEVLTEILGLHGEVLSTLRNRVEKALVTLLPLGVDPPDPSLEDDEFVNIVAQNFGMPEATRQDLLERNSVLERARALADLLEKK